MNFDPKRAAHESYDAYKERRAAINEATRRYLKGRLVWNSALGTALRNGKGYVVAPGNKR